MSRIVRWYLSNCNHQMALHYRASRFSNWNWTEAFQLRELFYVILLLASLNTNLNLVRLFQRKTHPTYVRTRVQISCALADQKESLVSAANRFSNKTKLTVVWKQTKKKLVANLFSLLEHFQEHRQLADHFVSLSDCSPSLPCWCCRL